MNSFPAFSIDVRGFVAGQIFGFGRISSYVCIQFQGLAVDTVKLAHETGTAGEALIGDTHSTGENLGALAHVTKG
jgi:hypothetical protein